MSGKIGPDPDRIRATVIKFMYSQPGGESKGSNRVDSAAQQAFKAYVQNEVEEKGLDALQAVIDLKIGGNQDSAAYKGMEAFLNGAKDVQKYVYNKMRANFSSKAREEHQSNQSAKLEMATMAYDVLKQKIGVNPREMKTLSGAELKYFIKALDFQGAPGSEHVPKLQEALTRIERASEAKAQLNTRLEGQDSNMKNLTIEELNDFINQLVDVPGFEDTVRGLVYVMGLKAQQINEKINPWLTATLPSVNLGNPPANLTAAMVSELTEAQCHTGIKAFSNGMLPEYRESIQVLNGRLVQLEKENTGKHVKLFFQAKGVPYPQEHRKGGYMATTGHCIAQANCFREYLLENNYLPKGKKIPEASSFAKARTIVRKMTLFIHPDKTNIPRESSQVLMGIAMTISRNVEALRKEGKK